MDMTLVPFLSFLFRSCYFLFLVFRHFWRWSYENMKILCNHCLHFARQDGQDRKNPKENHATKLTKIQNIPYAHHFNPRIVYFWPPFHIEEQFILQTVYGLKTEILHFLSLKSAVYIQERFQIESRLWWRTYGTYLEILDSIQNYVIYDDMMSPIYTIFRSSSYIYVVSSLE